MLGGYQQKSLLCLENNVVVESSPNSFYVKDIVEKKVLLVGGIEQGLYKLPMSPTLFPGIASSTTRSLPVYHIKCYSKVMFNRTL